MTKIVNPVGDFTIKVRTDSVVLRVDKTYLEVVTHSTRVLEMFDCVTFEARVADAYFKIDNLNLLQIVATHGELPLYTLVKKVD